MMSSLIKIVKKKSTAILVLALLLPLFPTVKVPGNAMPEAYAESSVAESKYLQSYNFPDRNIRHASDFSIRIDSNVDPAEDAQWRIVPGLTGGEGFISIESVNKPGYYITNNHSLAKLEQNDGTESFKAAATFKRVLGLAESTAVSYQTYTDPDLYMRHSGFVLRLDPISTPVAKTDATFQENPVSADPAAQSDAGFIHPGALFKNLTNVDPEGTGPLNAGLYAWKR